MQVVLFRLVLVDVQSLHVSRVNQVGHFSAVRVRIERVKGRRRRDGTDVLRRRSLDESNPSGSRRRPLLDRCAFAPQSSITEATNNGGQTLRWFEVRSKNNQAKQGDEDGSDHGDES